MGTLGTAIGTLIVGYCVESYGWKYGFLLLITVAPAMTVIPLGRSFIKEYREIKREREANREIN